MATKKIALNIEPHVAEVGDHTLLFQPEVMGEEFIDAYAELQEVHRRLSLDTDDLAGTDSEILREASAATRSFLARFMLPESAEEFTGMRLPGRVHVELLEWVVELYGGGRPPTSSPASAPASPRAGTRGTGTSRSKASTRTRGR